MPHKDPNAAKELSQEEAAKYFRSILDTVDEASRRQHNLDWVTERVTEHAQKVLDDSKSAKKLKSLALIIQFELGQLRDAIEGGRSKAAAVHGILVGAAAAELEVWDDIATQHWLTVSEAAELLAIREDTVSAYIKKGILRSNGAIGKGRRLVDPASVCWRLLNEFRSNAPE